MSPLEGAALVVVVVAVVVCRRETRPTRGHPSPPRGEHSSRAAAARLQRQRPKPLGAWRRWVRLTVRARVRLTVQARVRPTVQVRLRPLQPSMASCHSLALRSGCCSLRGPSCLRAASGCRGGSCSRGEPGRCERGHPPSSGIRAEPAGGDAGGSPPGLDGGQGRIEGPSSSTRAGGLTADS